MSEELKPCPFCGGKAVVEPEDFIGYGHWVACQSCGIQQGLLSMTEHEAIDAWNRRVES